MNKLIKKCKSEYYLDLINKNKGNSSAVWKTLNEITSRKSSVSITCIEIDDTSQIDVKSIVEGLNSHFSSIGSKLATLVKFRFGIIRRVISPSFVNGTRASTFSEFTFRDIDERLPDTIQYTKDYIPAQTFQFSFMQI